MEVLYIFWAKPAESVRLTGLYQNGRLVGTGRILSYRVSDRERKRWGYASFRTEVQDIYLEKVDYLSRFIEKIVKRFNIDIYSLSVSEWKEDYWKMLEEIRLEAYARSVLIYWDTTQGIPKRLNPRVEIRRAERDNLRELRRIQKESWGFFRPPNFRKQTVLLAYLDGEPVGSVYLNNITGNLDFGVHVRRNYQRQHVGATLLEYARRLLLSRGFKRMTVVRMIPLSKVRSSDIVALNFYLNCGGRIVREYRGFRKKRIKRRMKIVDLHDYIRKD